MPMHRAPTTERKNISNYDIASEHPLKSYIPKETGETLRAIYQENLKPARKLSQNRDKECERSKNVVLYNIKVVAWCEIVCKDVKKNISLCYLSQ